MIIKLNSTNAGHRVVTVRTNDKRSFIPLLSGDKFTLVVPDSALVVVSPAMSLEDASAYLLRKRSSK